PLIAFVVIAVVVWLGGQWPFIWGIASGAYVVRGPLDLYPVLLGPVEIGALFLGWLLLLPGANAGGDVEPA
ncbi:MAG TPA: hypothetical protein VKR80_05445, partial [Candidatus Limnocylindria bacterium]|nr:hypothetical protein [Candidatus Limnocylindria bacterium]